MRLSIYVAAGAATCIAAAASADVVTQTFVISPADGGYVQDGSELSPYISQKYGKSFGYLFKGKDTDYVPYQGSAASLTLATLTVTIDLGRDAFDIPISFNFMLYTGSDTSPQKQFETIQRNPVRTNSTGQYVFNKTFNEAERALLASASGTTSGTFFAEIFSSNFFAGSPSSPTKITAVLTFVPGPGGALVMTAFAAGGLARRRRAA